MLSYGRLQWESQINSANELVLTELILENTLATYEPEEVVALLSCFVFQEKTDAEPVIPPKLQEGLAAVMAIADRVEAVQTRHSATVEEFRALKPGLVEVVYEWAKGMVSSSRRKSVYALADYHRLAIRTNHRAH